MRYLMLNGGPRRANTWGLVEAAKEELERQDKDAHFTEIELARLDLPFCTGCSACFRLGEEKCPHRAAVGELVRQIGEADGVVFASPTYNLRETALLKNLFDHLCFMLHRPRFFQSKALILTSTGGVGAKKAGKSIASFLYGIGFNRCYPYGVAAYSWNDYSVTELHRKRLDRVVQRFCRDVCSKTLHAPSAAVLIPYNLFRGMARSYTRQSQYPTADGDHWTGCGRDAGVYDAAVKVPFYKKPVGWLFYGIGKFAGKRFPVTYRKSPGDSESSAAVVRKS
jgi:multimeric flavodoxin WrbA